MRIVCLQEFLDFPESFVPLPQNPQGVKSNLEQPCVGINYDNQTESEASVDASYTYSFHELVLEELNIGEENRRWDLEDFDSMGFKGLWEVTV